MENLIKKAKLRDADAFTELMQQQMQNMYKTARAVLYNEEDVPEIPSRDKDRCCICTALMYQDCMPRWGHSSGMEGVALSAPGRSISGMSPSP